MSKAPTSPFDVSAGADLAVNANLFARHLRASNKSPRTIKSYVQAVELLQAFVADRGMPLVTANLTREHVEAFITDQRTSA